MNDFTTGLTVDQKKAVLHTKGPSLVVAGAGTGKTTVITRRIANLIANHDVRPEEILALTFTDKAATEMEERLDQLLPYGVVSTNIMTFHSLGDRILREEGLSIGIAGDFVVMPTFSQVVFLQNIVAHAKLTYFKPLGDPFSFIYGLITHFSRLKDDDVTPQKYSAFARKLVKNADSPEEKLEAERIAELATLYAKYVEQARVASRLDFGDQIQLSLELFRQRPNVLAKYQQAYKYILVDEYQDTNTAQNELLRMLAAGHGNIMVVGDDDQAIYRFRGAALSNILEFRKQYPKTKQYVLQHNFRSTQDILDCAYRVIVHNNPNRLEVTNKINKQLIGAREKGTIELNQYDTISEEMEAVAERIAELIGQGAAPKEIAILVRKNNQGKLIMPHLVKHAIPFRSTQYVNLLDRAEVRILVNFTRFVNDDTDSAALYSLLASDAFHLDKEHIASLSAEAKRKHITLADCIRDHVEVEDMNAELLRLVNYREHLNNFGAGELLYLFLQQSGYLDRKVEESQSSDEAAVEVQNIAEFFQIVKDFELVTHEPNIRELWNFIDELHNSASDILATQSPLDTNEVIITTVHKAKGLEYEHVFLIDMVQNTFPATRRSDQIPVPEALLQLAQSKDTHVEEERRLFYVAATRAKAGLYMSFSLDHGGVRKKKPSLFVLETELPIRAHSSQQALPHLARITTFERQLELPFDPLARLQVDGWLHLGVNQIADYLRSPLEFWCFHVLSLPQGPFHRLVFGSSIHAAIEVYLRARQQGVKLKLADMLAAFENAWSSEGFVSLSHEQERKDQALTVLRRFWTESNKSIEVPIAIEEPFTLSIDELKVRISGRYDAVYESKEGIEVRDFKTGDVATQKKADERLKKNIQLDIYSYAWDQSHDTKVVSKSLYFVEHGLVAASSTIDHDKTLATIREVVEGIRERKFAKQGDGRLNLNQLL